MRSVGAFPEGLVEKVRMLCPPAGAVLEISADPITPLAELNDCKRRVEVPVVVLAAPDVTRIAVALSVLKTSSSLPGAVVPIPTLPALVMRRRSKSFSVPVVDTAPVAPV